MHFSMTLIIQSDEESTSLSLPALSVLIESQTLQLKSSYPASRSLPDLLNATDVMPQIILSWEYIASSWSARMSNRRHVASSDPVANACPLGKNWKQNHMIGWDFVQVTELNHRRRLIKEILTYFTGDLNLCYASEQTKSYKKTILYRATKPIFKARRQKSQQDFH